MNCQSESRVLINRQYVKQNLSHCHKKKKKNFKDLSHISHFQKYSDEVGTKSLQVIKAVTKNMRSLLDFMIHYQLCNCVASDFAFGKWKFDVLSWSWIHFKLCVVSSIMSKSRAKMCAMIIRILDVYVFLKYQKCFFFKYNFIRVHIVQNIKHCHFGDQGARNSWRGEKRGGKKGKKREGKKNKKICLCTVYCSEYFWSENYWSIFHEFKTKGNEDRTWT